MHCKLLLVAYQNALQTACNAAAIAPQKQVAVHLLKETRKMAQTVPHAWTRLHTAYFLSHMHCKVLVIAQNALQQPPAMRLLQETRMLPQIVPCTPNGTPFF